MARPQMMRKQEGVGYDLPDANQDPVDYNWNQRYPAMDAQSSYDRAGALDYAEGFDVPGYLSQRTNIEALDAALPSLDEPKVAAQAQTIRKTPEERAARAEQEKLAGYLAQIRYPQGNWPEGFDPMVGATSEQVMLANQATLGPQMTMEVNGKPASIVNALGQSTVGNRQPSKEEIDQAIQDIMKQKY